MGPSRFDWRHQHVYGFDSGIKLFNFIVAAGIQPLLPFGNNLFDESLFLLITESFVLLCDVLFCFVKKGLEFISDFVPMHDIPVSFLHLRLLLL